ncbi:MAG: hypothetical protein L0I24_20725 [Pseudonocardia sp.]|nr:hypothetical protein [Pseudonocardia sp.]MDN5933456.1 hypothetical protein [Pseudonocardia sp.]
MTSTTINAHPTGEHPAVIALGERIAADLRTLADLAQQHPAVAVDLARTVEHLFIVPRPSSTLAHHEVGDPLIERGAQRTEPLTDDDPVRTTQAWRLPAGAISLHVVRLAIPGDVDRMAAG